MRVQAKITLLLALVVTAFVAGALGFRAYDRFKFQRIAHERFAERNRSFDEFLERNGEPLQTFVEDSTCLDRLVAAISSGETEWCSSNLSDPTLGAYHANAIWIYRPDGSLFYQHDNLNVPDFGALPIEAQDFQGIFATEPLRHFFVQLPEGLMEVRGGTIHPSKDFQRKTKARGYFFAGRLWNRPTLSEMSVFTGNEISVAPISSEKKIRRPDKPDAVSFERVLTDWSGAPIARLTVRNTSQMVRELERESEVLMLAIVIFALLLLLLLSSSLVRWVRRPLKTIMESLKSNDPKPIEPLLSDNSEFGELAQTVRTFFSQRDNLIREMEERRVTEEALRAKEHELRHSQKMDAIGRLAGGVAHDFNNLLTAIIGYAELIMKRARHDPVISRESALIRKAGEQAANLTRQLLAFSRKQLLQPKVIDLNALVVDLEGLLRRVIGERFELHTAAQAEDGRVRADPTQLEQVILNLGVNARDAMPNGGVVTIRTHVERLTEDKAKQISSSLDRGEYVVLTVQDTGVGMDADTKARIFEPFFTTKGPGKGTGLGLATVYGIIEQSGGGICVESEIGRGTAFYIYLPHESGAVEETKTIAFRPPNVGNFETLLVVEDEDPVRQLLCDVLQENNYTVISAADGPTAIEISDQYEKQIDLLITDVVMPQMNGPELASRLSLNRPDLRVLYVSGYSADEISDCGADVELLQKPFSQEVLLLRIRDVLAKRYTSLSAEQSQLHFAI